MLYQYHDPTIGALFALTDDFERNQYAFAIRDKLLKIIWNRGTETVTFRIDDQMMQLEPNQMIAVTFVHHLLACKTALTVFAFNREFYCIHDHDNEVSCYGVLFFGAQHLPVVSLPSEEIPRYNMLYQIFVEEFQNKDNIQGEMLRVLLKRLIIKCTRLAKMQTDFQKLDDTQIDIIRKFNFLVDIHYKTKKKVSEYADLLHKSPKTLSNLFNLYNAKTPQQIIHERIILEAKRFLCFTDKSCKEISYALGFDEAGHFSKFFKKNCQKTPLAYKQDQEKSLEAL